MRFLSAAATGVLALAATPAFAVNGTLLTAYGTKAQGMGGASIALPQDAIAAANNPAGMSEVGDRVDVDVQCLQVTSKATFLGNDQEGDIFACLPEAGYNRQITPKLTLGISTFSSGAGFDYDENIFPVPRNDSTGTFFASVAVLPTATYKVTDRLAVGVSLAGGVQAVRISNFADVPNRGRRFAFGFGFSGGVLWKPTDYLSLGATYSSKIRFSKLKGYADDVLAPSNGQVDVPERYGVGAALFPTPKLKIAADLEHINWSDTQFGSLFGFRDQDVYRLGASYDVSPKWTVRGGTSLARNHIASDVVIPNILFVDINSKAVSLGATRKFGDGNEINFGVEKDFGSKLNGTGPSAGASLDTTMYIFSLGWGRRF